MDKDNIKVEDTESKEKTEEKKREFDITRDIIKNEFRGADLELALRKPNDYIGKIFTFGGSVV